MLDKDVGGIGRCFKIGPVDNGESVPPGGIIRVPVVGTVVR